ncbi:alkylphosphonate utilization protein [Microbacterium bovistercoris]|uniref:Alkylphosphonate utilization protein n=1 Tax=Microbacterium bovistercoris TaxID=2293570 RepID=A0A371NSJ0_9MICO|nr:zinc ribbon domain-containing protein YjdM [Microbacterium bovistercoris]REJ05186.1 alkylphosphonate utilization protein [Microbacterium bovistercoris]
MADQLPLCPECSSDLAYEMGALLVCPMCGHEWSPSEAASDDAAPAERVVKDAVGNVLADGDTVVVTTTIKVKGSPQGIKAGTKVRGIRLIDPVNGHDIDCKVDGFGAMLLKSSLVKKA